MSESRHYPALDLTWSVQPDEATIEQLLAELDATGPTAIEERPNGWRVFFTTQADRDRAGILVGTLDPAAGLTPLSVSDEAWAERSQAALGAVRVGRVIVRPPWAVERGDVASDSTTTVVTIQPSMGFGTGHHASTRLCLGLLQQGPITGLSVLDVGTGSGVLAIVASRLGAGRVVGIDFDADALSSARENLDLNDAGQNVALHALDLTTDYGLLTGTFDVVTANLTGAMLERFAGVLAGWVAPGGSLVASGFQRDEEAAVTQSLAAEGLTPMGRGVEDEWVALKLRRSLRDA